MSDFSVSVFLFICLIAAPTSAFLVSPLLLPIFVIFPILGFMSGGGLMRYSEEYNSKFKFGPEAVIGMVVATIIFVVGLRFVLG